MFTEAVFAETSKKVIVLFHSQKRVLKHTQKQFNDIFPNIFVIHLEVIFRYVEFKFYSSITFTMFRMCKYFKIKHNWLRTCNVCEIRLLSIYVYVLLLITASK